MPCTPKSIAGRVEMSSAHLSTRAQKSLWSCFCFVLPPLAVFGPGSWAPNGWSAVRRSDRFSVGWFPRTCSTRLPSCHFFLSSISLPCKHELPSPPCRLEVADLPLCRLERSNSDCGGHHPGLASAPCPLAILRSRAKTRQASEGCS